MKRLLLPAALLAMSSLSAATLYWDGTDTTADADGGSGTWDTATANWDDAATAGANAVFVSGTDSATFGGTAGTVTLGGAVNAGIVTFSSAGYVINTNGFDATWATIAGGTFGFTKAGNGVLTLTTGTTGPVSIEGGTLRLSNAKNAGSSTLTVKTGGVLDLNVLANQDVASNVIKFDGGNLNNSGTRNIGLTPGSIIVNADFSIGSTGTAANPFRWTGGTLDLGGHQLTQNASMWMSGATTIVTNGIYQLNNQLTSTQAQLSFDDSASLSMGATGKLTLTFSGTLKNVTAAAGSTMAVNSVSSITQTTAGARTIAATISGSNALTFAGVSGAVTTLTGANTGYSGATTINGGTIVTGSTSALGTGAVTLGGGTLQVGATNLSGIASLTVNTGTLDTTLGTVTTTGAFALAGGTWVLGNTADAITAGSFTLTGGVIDLTGFTNKSTAGTYSLISGTGTSSFTNANFTNGDAGFSYSIDGNGDLTVTAVPEPSTYGLLGAGALAAAAFVRRRRKAKSA